MSAGSYGDDVAHILEALERARAAFQRFTPGEVAARFKQGDDPVTEADTAVDTLLREFLPRNGDGWLSEETRDDHVRLERRRVWVVDPLDGTREFVSGIPEWCVSIGLVVDGEPVAGGICNPVAVTGRPTLDGARVVASRSEVKRGEWEGYREDQFEIRPMGSVAYKLSLVAAGLVDATWTLTPKHEWDVAAGVALVLAAGGAIVTGTPAETRFNRETPLLSRLIAASPGLLPEIDAEISRRG